MSTPLIGDPAALRIVESHQQIHDRRLARAGVADQRQRLARPRDEADALENPLTGICSWVSPLFCCATWARS